MNLRDELQAVYDTEHRLTPALVVEAWRAPEHPCHDRLEWDDGIAAEHWRETQAQQLIRSVRVTFTKADDTVEDVRYFTSVKREDGYAYEPSAAVAGDPLVREIVLRDMRRDWQQLRTRYSHMAEFFELVKADVEAA